MKVYTFDNKVLTHDNKWLKEAAAPQEIIIPIKSISEDIGIDYDLNDIPLNIPLTFSYTDYYGDSTTPPTTISFYMFNADWSSFEQINSNIIDKAATFTVTDKHNYTQGSLGVLKPNGSNILISNLSGYKLSYIG